MRTFDGANQFVQFDMHRLRVTVLGILDQEDHQKGDDCGSRIDDELPSIAKAEEWTGDQPKCYDPCRQSEDDRISGSAGRLFAKSENHDDLLLITSNRRRCHRRSYFQRGHISCHT